MLAEFTIYTGVATVATIGPVYKIRKFLSKVFKIPVAGWVLSIGYGLAISWILLNLFSFQSSLAGLANLTSSILFAVWLYYIGKNQ